MSGQSRREFLRTVGLSAGAALLPWGAGARAGEAGGGRPNILYILADDLGYGDVACQNPDSKIPTPNLDRLASQGMRFVDAHSPSAVCTPTRYATMTGRYCWRSSLKRGVLGGYSPPLLEPDRLTVASLLRQAGYSTACIGKWHLGMDWPVKPGAAARPGGPREDEIDFASPIRNGPCTRGFDSYFGISASLDMPPYAFIENDRVAPAPTERQPKQGYVRAGAKAPGFSFDRVLPELTARAVRHIAERANDPSGRPFFLYLALNAPHTPVAPSKAFAGKSGAGGYGDFVAEVDWSVGRVLEALEASGCAEKTLVIFTSDNGPETPAYPRIQSYAHYSMGSWRGVKRDLWEGGHRVPFMARWPGKIRSGSISREVICQTDLMATAASIAGAKVPANAGEDSYDLSPVLLGGDGKTPLREATVHHSGSGRFALRQGSWVFIDAPTGDDNKEPTWFKAERGAVAHREPAELYDLSQDPSERRNVLAEHRAKAAELKALLAKYQREGRSAPRR